MGEIIRSAPVSPLLRELRRQSGAASPRAADIAAAAPASPAPAMTAPFAAVPAAPLVPLAQTAYAAVPQAPVPALPDQHLEREQFDKELAALRVAAEKNAEDARLDAEQRGFEAGREEGEAEGRELLTAQAERLKTLAAQLVRAKAGAIEDAEDAIIDLAFAALCRILGHAGATREHVQNVVREAAATSHEREQLTIRLHPADLDLLRDADGSLDATLRLSADTSIELGGCIVDSANGTLDARLETQLTRLRSTLLDVRAARREQGEGL